MIKGVSINGVSLFYEWETGRSSQSLIWISSLWKLTGRPSHGNTEPGCFSGIICNPLLSHWAPTMSSCVRVKAGQGEIKSFALIRGSVEQWAGEGNGIPLQCSCLENPRDGRASWADIYGVTQSRTWLKWLSSSSSRTMGIGINCVVSELEWWVHCLLGI